VLLKEDCHYVDREDRVAAMPAVIELLTLGRMATCAASEPMLGFLFGVIEAMP